MAIHPYKPNPNEPLFSSYQNYLQRTYLDNGEVVVAPFVVYNPHYQMFEPIVEIWETGSNKFNGKRTFFVKLQFYQLDKQVWQDCQTMLGATMLALKQANLWIDGYQKGYQAFPNLNDLRPPPASPYGDIDTPPELV